MAWNVFTGNHRKNIKQVVLESELALIFATELELKPGTGYEHTSLPEIFESLLPKRASISQIVQAGGFQRKIRQTKVFSLISTSLGDLTAIGKSNYGQPIPLC